jgi:hypothetical protein
MIQRTNRDEMEDDIQELSRVVSNYSFPTFWVGLVGTWCGVRMKSR